ncbi:C2H2 type zinc-finger-domain-containing protein [Linnemannia elongata]|nr:C2H2 type zinc-finger-domain-containing protein [Linnemannia elongata]
MSSYAINVPTATIGQATTCLACGIRLPSLETQQLHHKSDWHTYNLKRKMVGLPPVSAEVFSQLVTASREQANPEEVAQPECVPCSKKYLSFQAYDNHLQSKKHKQIAAAYAKKQQEQEHNNASRPTENDTTPAAEPSKETSGAAAVEQREPSETVCLFCSHESTDAPSNYGHMRTTHGFFLPSSERLIDLEGMLAYLADKLVENLDCLWCTPSVFSTHLRPDQELNSGFANLASVRRHMVDKGHCKLAMEHGADREYADFYLPENSFDSDDEEEGLENAEQHKESSQEDSSMDEDEQRLNMVLLDNEGNWILDEHSSKNSGIRIDPLTNELVLNNRRLAHKDAARRQKVESRTIVLASSRPNQRRPSTEEGQETGTSEQSTESGANGTRTEVLLASDVHHPDVKLSNSLLKSQNQLSESNLAVSVQQRQEVALKNAKAQDYESTKRERMATNNALKANIHGRRNMAVNFGLKV